jgi:hypothetical protein
LRTSTGAGRDVVRPQVEGAAAFEIEAGVVPVAGQNPVLDAAAFEREAHVRTAIVEGEDAPTVVDDEDRRMVAVHDEPTLRLELLVVVPLGLLMQVTLDGG